jgi:hypothetical protein
VIRSLPVFDSGGEMAVEITRLDLSAADLRRQAGRSQDAKAARRMLAVALVLEGHARGDAARSCGMDRQTLRDWVHSYNTEGVRASRTGSVAMARRLACPRPRRPRWPAGSRRVRTWPRMASCAGGGWICGLGSSGSSPLACTSARSGSCFPRWTFLAFPCVRSTLRAIRRRRRFLKGFRRARASDGLCRA